MKRYAYTCCRCGICCLGQTCPVARELLGVGAQGPCPALEWKSGLASCGLLRRGIPADVLGIGAGCCIKGRAMVCGQTVDFATLPVATKRGLGQRARAGALAIQPGVKL